MNSLRFLFSFLAMFTFSVVACQGVSDPQLGRIGDQSGPTGRETAGPEPALADSEQTTSTGAEDPSGATASGAPDSAQTGPSGYVSAASDSAENDSAENDSAGTTIDVQALLSEAFSSPDLMGCLAASLGKETVVQIAERSPTDAETALIFSCLGADAGAQSGGSPPEGGTSNEPEQEPQTLLAQALDSPGLMWCLAGHMGMEPVIQAGDRELSAEEERVVQNCMSDRREIAAWDAEWPKRIDAAFEPTQCGAPAKLEYPASYYQGPLIESHLHLPQLPDDQWDSNGVEDEDFEASRGVDSELYDTIPAELRPLLGRTITINEIACTLENEGSRASFTFFPVFPEITAPAIEVARRAAEAYPSLFVPFIQASAAGSATLDGEILDAMLDVEPGLFFGFGEVGDSPTESINPLPDSEIYTGDFEVARDRGLAVYFHTGEGHGRICTGPSSGFQR